MMARTRQNKPKAAPAISDAKLRRLKAHWREIVGHDLAAITSPLKLAPLKLAPLKQDDATAQVGKREKGPQALYIELSPYASEVAEQLRRELPRHINGYLDQEVVSYILLVEGQAPQKNKEQILQKNSSRIIKRRRSLAPIAKNLPRLTRQIVGKKRMLGAEIIENWPAIVGAQLAEQSLPLKYQPARRISDAGSLLIKVDSAFVTKVQYQSDRIIDSLNQYFGYRAVGKINLRQVVPAQVAPVKKKNKRSPSLPLSSLTSSEREAIERSFEDLENSRLRKAIIRLQSTLTARKKTKA